MNVIFSLDPEYRLDLDPHCQKMLDPDLHKNVGTYADLNHCFFLILLLLFTDEMLVTSVDRGGQLEALRAAEQLTDVTIMAEGVRIPAHKLLLSLHSHYFRSGDDY